MVFILAKHWFQWGLLFRPLLAVNNGVVKGAMWVGGAGTGGSEREETLATRVNSSFGK